jgi:Flp pilus assembly protein protease CpaA
LLSPLDFSILLVTILSVFFDLTVRRIPNWVILFGLVVAFLLNASQGFTPLTHSLIGFIAAIGIFIVPFALGWMGAGDVKYFAVICAMLGIEWLPRVLFYSVLVAGAIALGYVAIGRFRSGFFRGAWNDCKLAIVSLGRILPGSISTKTAKGVDSVPWGVAIGVGTIVAYYFDPTGRLAGF